MPYSRCANVRRRPAYLATVLRRRTEAEGGGPEIGNVINILSPLVVWLGKSLSMRIRAGNGAGGLVS
jgi:hypothetical protein